MKGRLKIIGFSLIMLATVAWISIGIVRVDNNAMEGTIKKGQLLLINKLAYAILNPFTNQAFITFKQPTIGELIAFHNPKLSDVAISKKPILVKRCIGKPADLVSVRDKNVFINKSKYAEPNTIHYKYRLVSEANLLDDEFVQRYGLIQGSRVGNLSFYDFSMTKATAKLIETDERVMSIRNLRGKEKNSAATFPSNGYFNWSKDYYGEVQIPFKGLTVQLDYKNFGLYKKIINEFEGNEAFLKVDKVFINEVETDSYTFTADYYFVMDDNRDFADDSRYWGFLPANHIIGKVMTN